MSKDIIPPQNPKETDEQYAKRLAALEAARKLPYRHPKTGQEITFKEWCEAITDTIVEHENDPKNNPDAPGKE